MSSLQDNNNVNIRRNRSFGSSSRAVSPDHTTDCRITYLFLACITFIFLQTRTFQTVASVWNAGYWSPFNKENPNPLWCPYADCNNSPMCQPCKRRFLIVIATGRSGSTTLTNMLDQLPNVRMAGENNGQLQKGFEAVQNVEDPYELNVESEQEVVGAWKHEPIAEQSMACPVQQMFEVLNPPPVDKLLSKGYDDSNMIIGFKTVRFHGDEMLVEGSEELGWMPAAKFLVKTFPCARFVINLRGDVESQKVSWEKAFGVDLDGDEVRRYNRHLTEVASFMGQDRARLIDMVEWSKKDDSGIEVLNELIDWLGFRECRYKTLLHENRDGYGNDRTKVSLGPNCHYPGL